jgi:hypothetical protein
MAKYKAYAQYTVELEIDIEASSLDEAQEIANDADGAAFKEIGLGDWVIYDLVEVENERQDI